MIRLAYPDLGFREVKKDLKRTIDSGWLTKGPRTRELEAAISNYVRIRHAVAVSSGTAALHLSLLSLGIGPGDEVIVPDFTFPAAANVVELCAAKPVFADIEPNSFNVDPVEIERKITSRTRALIVVHQFGSPADMARILKIARRHKLYVVEDAACGLGARYREKMCGSMGDLGCFSFHPRKIISTGEGGAVVTNNVRLARRLKLLREHGMVETAAGKSFASVGFNYRISEISSILGLAQLKKIEQILKKRNALAKEFRKIISSSTVVSPAPLNEDRENRSTYQSFVVKIDKKINIFKLIAFLRSRGIESTVSNIVLHSQPYYRRKYGFRADEFKNSAAAFSNCIALPFHCRLNRKDFLKITAALKEYFNRRKASGI